MAKKKTCTKCKIRKSAAAFGKNSRMKDGKHYVCKSCMRMYQTGFYKTHDNYIKLKVKLFTHYAKAVKGRYYCRCCGESEIAFLTLICANGNSRSERKEHSSMLGYFRWLASEKFPTGHVLEVSCQNCIEGRAINDGICPHKAGNETKKKKKEKAKTKS